MCKLLDCQKLSQEACAHAAQNERLPVQAVVQVLYFEQMRIRNVMGGPHNQHELDNFQERKDCEERVLYSGGSANLCAFVSPERDHYASIKKENQELKLEVAKMRMRLIDLERQHDQMKNGIQKGYPPRQSHNDQHGFFHAFYRSMGKLNPFHSHKTNQGSHNKLQPPHYEELLCYQGGRCTSVNHSSFDLSWAKV